MREVESELGAEPGRPARATADETAGLRGDDILQERADRDIGELLADQFAGLPARRATECRRHRGHHEPVPVEPALPVPLGDLDGLNSGILTRPDEGVDQDVPQHETENDIRDPGGDPLRDPHPHLRNEHANCQPGPGDRGGLHRGRSRRKRPRRRDFDSQQTQ
ncbi:hypothetical protein IU476_07985 [Nocardia blacklockiae]|nr:hypothetical protein [Nocardia blacklockiae]